ncbi:MAG: flagellar export protein FliJ [Methylomonas sp.]|nr:flagellar export protein FliJ [Methylomonas sp.]
MKRSQRLQTIIDLHSRQENDALKLLGNCQQQLEVQQAQLENLLSYRQEYLSKLIERQQAGMNVSQLLEFRAFADKLDKAIDGQHQAVERVERDVQRARAAWEECHQRTKSLQKLGELAVAEELKIENKREQSEQDARAARSPKKDGTRSA